MDLRHRGPLRSSTSTDDAPHGHKLRRDSTQSTASTAASEARNYLLLPRGSPLRNDDNVADSANCESHWHSVPLVLALLPAVAEFFFRDGAAFITDVTLLILAATFLNWSVSLPW